MQKRKVTINGIWPNQPKHHLSFENPCLTKADIVLGKKIRQEKVLSEKISFCFVGRLEKEKGVERIIKAFNRIEDKTCIGTVHLVGEGQEMNYFKELGKKSNIDFVFHGALARKEVFEIYKKSDVFLLPTTASEGFPKVIAEAMNFGCIPLVSNISAIGHYIENEKQGVLLDPVTTDNLIIKINNILNIDQLKYRKLLNGFDDVVVKFTFSYYNSRIKNQILNS
jgi:glycosyltransferase involved in cell wall biosynthesis